MKKTTKILTKPVLATIGLAAGFASMGAWIRMMSGSFDTWQQVYLRILIAGLIAAVIFRKDLGGDFLSTVRTRDWMIYFTRGFFAYVLGLGFFTIAVQHTQLGTVAFVSSLPLLGLFAWVMFREKIKPQALGFVGLSVIGLILITGVDVRHFYLGVGEAAAIVCLIGFDIGSLMSRYHPRHFSNVQNTALLLWVSWIPIFFISISMHEQLGFGRATAVGWLGLAVSSVFNVGVMYVINYIFSAMKAYVVGNLLLLEGVFALIVGFVLYREVPSLLMLAGAGIILICAYAISLIDARSDRLEAAHSDIG